MRSRILGTDMQEHVTRVATFGPEEPALLEGYRPNAPVITLQDEMRLHVGDHTLRMVSMPGHTLAQAAVIVEEEGVVFTSVDGVECAHGWHRGPLARGSSEACARRARPHRDRAAGNS